VQLLDSSSSACPGTAIITVTLPLLLLMLLRLSACLLHDSSPHNIGSSTSQQHAALPVVDCGSPGIKTASAAGLTGI